MLLIHLLIVSLPLIFFRYTDFLITYTKTDVSKYWLTLLLFPKHHILSV